MPSATTFTATTDGTPGRILTALGISAVLHALFIVLTAPEALQATAERVGAAARDLAALGKRPTDPTSTAAG
jgi:hypothetical protein